MLIFSCFLCYFCVFSNARNLENCAPVEARAQFLQNCILHTRRTKVAKIDKKRHGFWCEFGIGTMLKIIWKIDGFWGQKSKKSWKNRCQKRIDFSCRFFSILASILEPLGPPSWSQVGHLGVSWSTFWSDFLMLPFAVSSGSALGRFWLRFG